ncbi:MAG: hypothetical protein EOP54_27665 [Sphingobacteriales bacterium]|nr:MAG: hypothetical protein EOP54_27665 [Sphingobacteriales bacterium]
MHRFTNTAFILLSIVCIWGCTQPAANKPAEGNAVKPSAKLKNIAHIDADVKVIHVFVALCDNKYQGIVPVPKAIGNG